MCRAERMCKLSVYMKTEAAYVPPHPFTEAEVHTHFCQPSALPGTKKRRRDFQRGEPWFTSLAPCEARNSESQALTIKRVKYRKSESSQPRKAACEGCGGGGSGIIRDNARRMPRHESVFTHDRANGISDDANTGAASRCCSTHHTLVDFWVGI